jgi:hypothetical protein
LLKPLRNLDRRSSIKNAQDRLNGISDQETQVEETQVEETGAFLTPVDYTNIMHCCWEMCRLMKNRSNNSFFNDTVGFKLLAYRTISGTNFMLINKKDITVNRRWQWCFLQTQKT